MNEDFEQALRRQLNRAEHRIDARTRVELATIRGRALTANRHKWRLPRFALPATGVALASLTLLLLTPSPGTDSTRPQDLSVNNLDLYQDIDFYFWLAEGEAGGES